MYVFFIWQNDYFFIHFDTDDFFFLLYQLKSHKQKQEPKQVL